MKKKLFPILVVVFVLCLSVFGVQANGAEFDEYARPRIVANEDATIAFITDQPSMEYFVRGINQAEIEGVHRGWNVMTLQYEDEQSLRDTIQNVINQDVTAIVLMAQNNMESKSDLVDQARNAGIGFYGCDSQLINGMLVNVGVNNAAAGAELIYHIESREGWDDNIAALSMTSVQQHIERIDVMQAAMNAYAGVTWLSTEDIAVSPSFIQDCYDATKALLQLHDDDLSGIVTPGDAMGISAAEAVIQSGDPNGDKCWVASMDGTASAMDYIRNDTPLKYVFAQPIELYVHEVFEVINQLQVEGINPGDPESKISAAGETIYVTGSIVDNTNVPEIGSPIHVCFDYYDAADTGAWYNWSEGPGIYTVSAAN